MSTLSTTDLVSKRPFAVVTGASSGIGLALAHEFARNGYDLLITAEGAVLEDVAAELRTDGVSVHTLRADLSTYDGVEMLWSEVLAYGQPVDAIAINAGVGVSGDFARETNLADELRMVGLNVNSVIHLAKRVLGTMIKRGEGKILFTSSIVATSPAPYLAVYAATKAFVLSFAEGIRHELQDTNITITALMPGATDTNFFRRAGMQDTEVAVGEKDDPAMVAYDAFEALMAGKDKVVAGSMMNKVRAMTAGVIPETVLARQQAGYNKPGSAHKA
jgi:uncharacterized protein